MGRREDEESGGNGLGVSGSGGGSSSLLLNPVETGRSSDGGAAHVALEMGTEAPNRDQSPPPPPPTPPPLSDVGVSCGEEEDAEAKQTRELVLHMGRMLAEHKRLEAEAAMAAGVLNPSLVLDVKSAGGKRLKGDGGGSGETGKECRICHLDSDPDRLEGSELILLGCGCKEDLGTAHRHCAEAWFRLKGNRCCEICGAYAENITGIEEDGFMEEWNERRMLSNFGSSSASEGGCWRNQPFCKFLIACLVIAFILPWFFRVSMF